MTFMTCTVISFFLNDSQLSESFSLLTPSPWESFESCFMYSSLFSSRSSLGSSCHHRLPPQLQCFHTEFLLHRWYCPFHWSNYHLVHFTPAYPMSFPLGTTRAWIICSFCLPSNIGNLTTDLVSRSSIAISQDAISLLLFLRMIWIHVQIIPIITLHVQFVLIQNVGWL